MLEEEPFATLFESESLHLPKEGEHTWRFRFPPALLKVLAHPTRTLTIEEHPYHGASKRQDGCKVTKLVCHIGGAKLVPIIEARGTMPQYIAPALATVSRYRGGWVTLKELRVSQLDPQHWQLVVWVWRGHTKFLTEHTRLANYRAVVATAKNFAVEHRDEKKGELIGPAN